MNLKNIDIKKFISLGFVERIFYIYSVYGERLWSWQLAEIWSLISKEIEDPDDRSLMSRQMIQLAPHSEASEAVFEDMFEGMNSNESQAVERVHIIVSCEKYLHKSELVFNRLSDRLQHLFIVIGRPELKTARFDGKFLYVPTQDSYENVPYKVLESFAAVTQRFGPVAIIKMDDDVIVEKSHRVDRLSEILAGVDYAGELAGGKKWDRCWHMGKCEDPNTPIDTKISHGYWARGPLYYLGQKAVRILIHEYIFFPGEITGHVLEDKLISDMLRRFDITLDEIDLETLVGLKTTNESLPQLDVSTTY